MMMNNSANRRPASPTARRAPQKKAPLDQVLGWFSLQDHRYTAAKALLLVLLVVYIFFVVGGNSAKNVNFDLIAMKMFSDPTVSALQRGDENVFRDRFGLDPDGCEGWLLYTTDSLMDVSKLLIVKTADSGVRDRIEAAAQARIDTQTENFRNYGTNQLEQLEHSILWQRGNYLFYGVSDYVDRWEEEFLSCIQ